MTYSIIGRDETSGELGGAVQSRAFGVGMCAWARPGVGAIATQSFTERSYGPRGLELLAAGVAPVDALAELAAADEQRDFRQVAFLAADGRTAAHTGAACIPDCGHVNRDGLSAQGNMLASPAVWHAAADTFATAEGTLAERLSTSASKATPSRSTSFGGCTGLRRPIADGATSTSTATSAKKPSSPARPACRRTRSRSPARSSQWRGTISTQRQRS